MGRDVQYYSVESIRRLQCYFTLELSCSPAVTGSVLRALFEATPEICSDVWFCLLYKALVTKDWSIAYNKDSQVYTAKKNNQFNPVCHLVVSESRISLSNFHRFSNMGIEMRVNMSGQHRYLLDRFVGSRVMIKQDVPLTISEFWICLLAMVDGQQIPQTFLQRFDELNNNS